MITHWTTDLVAGQAYTLVITGWSGLATDPPLMITDGAGNVIPFTVSALLAGAYPNIYDLTVEGDTLTFNFVAETTGTYDFSYDEGSVPDPYVFSVSDFSGAVGTNKADLIMGADIGETVNLRKGADRFLGGDGDDHVQAGAGRDQVYGGGGNDTLLGGRGDDQMDGGIGNDWLNGGRGRDKLVGGAGDDRVIGQNGNDLIYGNAGNDTLLGGKNNDRLYGGQGDDYAVGGLGNDKVHGNAGNDTVIGGHGHDAIYGGRGADVLDGGHGRDTLTGGAGADTFVFGTRAQRDTVTDFQDGLDQLDISAFGYTEMTDFSLSQNGADVVINLQGGNLVTLLNTDVAMLDASDFIF